MEESVRKGEKRALILVIISVIFIIVLQKVLMIPTKYFLNMDDSYLGKFISVIFSGLIGYLIIAGVIHFDDAEDARLFFRKIAYLRFLVIGATLPPASAYYMNVTAPPYYGGPEFSGILIVMTWIIVFLTIFSVERMFYAEISAVISYFNKGGAVKNPREYYLDLLSYGFRVVDPALIAGAMVIAGLFLVFINIVGGGVPKFVNSFSDFLYFAYAYPLVLPSPGRFA